MNRQLLAAGVLCVVLTAKFLPASAASTTIYAIDPQAHKILNQMQAAYSDLQSLSEQIVLNESPSLVDPVILHTTLSMERPGLISMTSDSKSARSGSSRVVTDGDHCYVAAPQYPARFLKFPVPATSQALIIAGSEGITSGFTVGLFSDPEAVTRMFSDSALATLRLQKPIWISGQRTDVVVATDTNGMTLTFYIGNIDHLVRKISVIYPNNAGDFTETYSALQTNKQLNPVLFKFDPQPKQLPYYASSFTQLLQDAPN